MAATQSCGPLSASMAARWVMDDTFDVAWLCTTLHAAISSAGPMAHPQRQPVMA